MVFQILPRDFDPLQNAISQYKLMGWNTLFNLLQISDIFILNPQWESITFLEISYIFGALLLAFFLLLFYNGQIFSFVFNGALSRVVGKSSHAIEVSQMVIGCIHKIKISEIMALRWKKEFGTIHYLFLILVITKDFLIIYFIFL